MSSTNEVGSLSIEPAMPATGMRFIFGLILAYGVVGQINGTFESGRRGGRARRSAGHSHGLK